MISKDHKQELITKFKTHGSDTGSSHVQVAVLTARIQQLTEHLKTNKNDFSSRRGLLKMVGRRRRLLNGLRRGDFQGYSELINRLGIRK